MASIKITLLNKKIGEQFRLAQSRHYRAIQRAEGATVKAAASQIKQRGDRDIRAGGKFGTRWTQGFRVGIFLKGTDYVIRVSHDIFYFTVFEFGKIIRGKPLLWIPLSFARDAQGVRARDYPRPLFRVNRKGKAPLLMTKGGEPKYFGKTKVRIPRKFHIRDIVRAVSRGIKPVFRDLLKQEKRRG